MRKYPTYKPSGVDWLGEIPSNWRPIKLKFMANRITKGTTPTTVGKAFVESGINFVKVECISETGTIIKENCAFIDEETHRILNRSQLKKDDILIAIAGAIGRVAIVEDAIIPANTNQAVGIISVKKNKYDLRWVKYVLNSDAIKQHYNIEVVQTAQANLSLENVGLSLLPTPSFPEQQSIVRFLDYKTGQIDSFIANRQKQIELLKEQKAGIINKAVTKGINPDAKMKPSGIEWIGEIPEHWGIWKVSRLFKKIGSGTTPKAGTPLYYEDGTIPWINTGDLNDGILEDCATRITEKAFADHSTLKIYKKGTLLIAMYGATIAKLSVLNFDACTNQACCALADSKLIKIDFAFNWFLSQKQNIINLSYGGGQPNISQDVVRSIRIPLPPNEEQQSIIEFITSETAHIDSLSSKYQKQIDLMQEYRTSLISQAVTGKIDVREWQSQNKEKA